ncbi:tau 95 subunit of transcription factor TFIIIC, partial [Coelomomyces lativittatus]
MVRMISEKGKVDGEETVSSTSKLKPVNDVTTMPTSFHIPQHVFVALDYPGYVLKWEQVLHTLGGLTHLAECYQSSKDDDTSSSQLTNATKPIELRFRPDDPFSHPIMGHFCSTCNLVVRMVRRRRQRQRRHKEGGTVPPWSYTMEIQGIVIDTGRFRGLADFQWIPEPSDPITQLRSAMTDLDLTRMLSYELNSEDTKLNPIRSFPPPNFSRTELPKNYDFKQSHALTKVQVQNPDGTMSFRLHNPFTHSKAPPIPSVSYLDPIPTTPPDGPFVRHFPSGWKDVLLQKFEERPAWTKLALFNTLTSHPQVKHKLRHLLPLVAYFVTSGPWKFTWVKLGVDPKSHSRYRFFQTLDTRNYYRHASSSSSSSSSIVYSKGRVLGTHKTKSSSSSHLFHGLQRFDSTSIFQLCDLVDPILSELVYTQGYLRDVAH